MYIVLHSADFPTLNVTMVKFVNLIEVLEYHYIFINTPVIVKSCEDIC